MSYRYDFLALGCVGAIVSAPALAAPQTAQPAQPPQAETAAEARPRALGGVVVTDTVVEDGYRVERASNPLLPQPLRDTPRTVTVLDKEFLSDVQAVSFSDALRQVPGITLGVGEGGAGSGDFINLRGFDASNDIAIDGFADRLQYSRSDVFNLEQIEVYKGPNSALSGAGGAAGLINLVTKAPQGETFVRAEAGLGNRDWKRGTIDANAVLDGSGNVAARLNLMAHDQGVAGRDFIFQRRFGIAPSIGFGLNGPTRLIASLQFQEDDNLIDYGVPYLTTGVRPAFPISNYYGWRNVDGEDQSLLIATIRLEHDFSDTVRFQTGVRWGEVERTAIWSTPRPLNPASLNAAAAAIAAGNTAGAVYTARGPQGLGRFSRNEVLAARATLTLDWPVSGRGLGNTLVIGAEASREQLDRETITTTGLAGAQRNLFAPTPDFTGTLSQTRTSGQFENRAERLSAFAFDTVKLGEWLQVNLGGRYERFDVTLGGTNYAALADRTTSENLWSWQGGVVLKPSATSSLYASYSNARQPQTLAATATGTVTTANLALPALENENYELGGKIDLFGEALSLTAAIFRTERVNEPITVDGDIVLAGRRRVEGLELSATGNITPRWQVYAAYAYLRSEILRAADTASVTQGEELALTPQHSGTFWTSYTTGFGLRLGGGVNYMGRLATRNSTAIQAAWDLDDYLLVNAMAEYSFTDNLSVQVNVNNIANTRFINRIRANDSYVIAVPGEGRTAVATLRLRY